MTAAREVITMSDLSSKLTLELQAVDGAAESKISVQYKLAGLDEDGCNWSDDIVLSLDPKSSSQLLFPHVANIVSLARRKYNIK